MMYPNIFSLKGKVALVTGASGGLGRYFALTLASAGAIVGVGARRMEKVNEVVDEIKANGGEGFAVSLDVTSPKSTADAFACCEKEAGIVSVLLNNAGTAGREDSINLTEQEWDRVLETNLNGVWRVTKEAARRMILSKTRGSIINISSILGLRVMPSVLSYCVSKAGVAQMTKVLALEWARYGIRVNAIAPGYFETDMNRGLLQSSAGEKIRGRIPQRRTGNYEELSGPLLLLASDASSYMTGEIIAVDGGHLISGL
jgi:NAD(P)-dependent dehydrogenase (short-subunit alcohol dehydrogenase family)